MIDGHGAANEIFADVGELDAQMRNGRIPRMRIQIFQRAYSTKNARHVQT